MSLSLLWLEAAFELDTHRALREILSQLESGGELNDTYLVARIIDKTRWALTCLEFGMPSHEKGGKTERLSGEECNSYRGRLLRWTSSLLRSSSPEMRANGLRGISSLLPDEHEFYADLLLHTLCEFANDEGRPRDWSFDTELGRLIAVLQEERADDVFGALPKIWGSWCVNFWKGLALKIKRPWDSLHHFTLVYEDGAALPSSAPRMLELGVCQALEVYKELGVLHADRWRVDQKAIVRSLERIHPYLSDRGRGVFVEAVEILKRLRLLSEDEPNVECITPHGLLAQQILTAKGEDFWALAPLVFGTLASS